MGRPRPKGSHSHPLNYDTPRTTPLSTDHPLREGGDGVTTRQDFGSTREPDRLYGVFSVSTDTGTPTNRRILWGGTGTGSGTKGPEGEGRQ